MWRCNLLLVADTMTSPGNLRGLGTSETLETPETSGAAVQASIAVAVTLAERIERKAAPVRQRFVMRLSPEAEPPPLAQLLRGGRGGEVKLKVYLSLLWAAVADPYDVSLPGRVWAQLIGLPDPAGRGAHRVNGAFRTLVGNQLLRAESRPGLPSRFYLLEETGSGRAYLPPGGRLVALKNAGEDFSDHIYLQVPAALWTHGWIACLGGPGLAMLLVLIAQAGGRDPEDLWFSPGVADQRFHLSAETRKRGLDQLVELGLATVGRRPVARSVLDSTRLRNTYTLKLGRLDEIAPQ